MHSQSAFSKYFRRYKAEETWNHVSAKASRYAGFEDEVQTNNIPKYANAFLKRWQDFQATDMASFIDDCKGLIVKQRRDVKRTLLWLSYILRPEYQNSRKETDDFFDNQPGRHDHATISLKVVVDPVNFKKVYGHRPAPPQTQLHQNAAINLSALSDLLTEKRLLGEKAQNFTKRTTTVPDLKKKRLSREKQVSANAPHCENSF